MKRILASLALILTVLVSQSLADQSASKIVGRYKKAAGGKAAARVKSTTVSGSIKANDGAAGRYSYQISAPNNLRLDLEIGGSKVSECYNGKSAWRLDARGLRTRRASAWRLEHVARIVGSRKAAAKERSYTR